MGLLDHIRRLLRGAEHPHHLPSPPIQNRRSVNAPVAPGVRHDATGLIALGTTEPVCPSCAAPLPKMPPRKMKCPHCANAIYRRTRPLDQRKILLRESDLESLEEQWAIANGNHDSLLRRRQQRLDFAISLETRYGPPIQFDEHYPIVSGSGAHLIPPGFPRYSADDFERQFRVSRKLAEFIATDYHQVVDAGVKSYISEVAAEAAASRDLAATARKLEFRYGLNTGKVGAIAIFFANVATSKLKRDGQLSAGITNAKWWWSGACAIDGHAEADGKDFAVSEGLRINECFVYPGVFISCSCSVRVNIPGFID